MTFRLTADPTPRTWTRRGGHIEPQKWMAIVDSLPGTFIRLKTVAGLNAREHWAVKAKRSKNERKWGWAIGRGKTLPARVTFCRYSSAMMDSDNLPQCFKALRDGIADSLGCGDAPTAPVEWLYRQEKCPRGCYGVRVLIESAAIRGAYV